jgi:hypothetical protein
MGRAWGLAAAVPRSAMARKASSGTWSYFFSSAYSMGSTRAWRGGDDVLADADGAPFAATVAGRDKDAGLGGGAAMPSRMRTL